MITEVLRTTRRVYYLYQPVGLKVWRAEYRPLNPKTGAPWQASRSIRGWDVYQLARYDGTTSEVLAGTPPSFQEWSKQWSSLCQGFSSEEKAREVIARDVAKNL